MEMPHVPQRMLTGTAFDETVSSASIVPMDKKILVLVVISIALAALVTIAAQGGMLGISLGAALAMRWAALFVMALYGLRRRSLTVWILIMMIIGAEAGHDWPAAAANLRVLGLVFLRLIRTIIAPLLFGTLVVGIAGHSNLKQVGRMALKSLIYFEVVTTVALFIGLAAINLSRAGQGVTLPPDIHAEQLNVPKESASDVILHIFPENIAKSIADGQVLQIVVFSVIFAIALALIGEEKRRPILSFCESLSETMFKFTNIVMLFAPIGVGAAIAYTVGTMGLGVVVSLIKLLLTLYAALTAFVLFVLLPVALLVKVPIARFIRAVSEPASIAFATTSSEAALPRAMEAMEALGVPRQIVAFVIPAGYSFNLDGTTLYLSLASVFVAQVAGIHMGFGRQLLMVFTLMLTSKGAAGVPRAALVILLATSASFGLPVEPIFVLLGIDAVMDMGRTSINVIGNCLATVVIAIWERQFNAESPSMIVQEATID